MIAPAALIHLAARTNEVWVLVSEQGAGLSGACSRVASLAEDITDKWPHSVPAMTAAQVLQSKPPDNVSCVVLIFRPFSLRAV